MSRTTLLMREKRRKWVEQGLTTQGYQRTNKLHPELAGLGGKTREYHTRWTRKQREQDRLAWAKPSEQVLSSEQVQPQYEQ